MWFRPSSKQLSLSRWNQPHTVCHGRKRPCGIRHEPPVLIVQKIAYIKSLRPCGNGVLVFLAVDNKLSRGDYS
jgi:hypothetical protein